MSAFVVRRAVDAPLDAVWAAVTDFGAYGRWIPLTAMAVDAPPLRVGWAFAGRTGIGPAGFVDSMLLTEWQPPGPDGTARFRVRKTGRLLGGWADVGLATVDDGRTEVIWREEIVLQPAPLGRLLAPLLDRVNARLFDSAVGKMLASVQVAP